MKTIKLSDVAILDSLLYLDFGTVQSDLHSDFLCTNISFNLKDLDVTFKSNKAVIHILLRNCYLNHASFQFGFESLTLDNFYRGRIEDNGVVVDIDSCNRKGFYFHFYEDVYLEVFAEEALASYEEETSEIDSF